MSEGAFFLELGIFTHLFPWVKQLHTPTKSTLSLDETTPGEQDIRRNYLLPYIVSTNSQLTDASSTNAPKCKARLIQVHLPKSSYVVFRSFSCAAGFSLATGSV